MFEEILVVYYFTFCVKRIYVEGKEFLLKIFIEVLFTVMVRIAVEKFHNVLRLFFLMEKNCY